MTSTLTPAGAPLRVFGEPNLRTDGDLSLVAFSADGTLWSMETTGLLRRWTKVGEPIDSRAVSDLETEWAFNHDARFAVSGSQELGLWDVLSGRQLATIEQDSWVSAVAAGRDPTFAVTGHEDGSIHCWSMKSRESSKTLIHHKKQISALAIHADGRTLAAASEDRTITIWDAATGELLATLRGHTDRIPALAWHPSGHVLVSAGWDATARVWDALKSEPIILLNSHAAQVTALAFSPDGRWLATADSGRRVHVWDYAKKAVHRILAGPTVEVRSLAFAPDGTTLAATGDRVIHLWDAAAGQPLAGVEHRTKVKPSVSVSADGALIAGNTDGASCKIWSAANRQLAFALTDGGQIHQVAFHPKKPWIAAARRDRVRLWDAATGAILRDFDGPERPLTILAISPDGAMLAAGAYDDAPVWLWNVETGEPTLIIPDPLQGCAPQSLAFLAGSPRLAIAGVDWLATGGSTGALSVWDIAERAEISTVPDGFTSLAARPDGRQIAACSLDRSIALFDAETLDLQAELLGHDGAAGCVAYSPDGQLLASGGDDQTVRFWNDAGDEVGLIEVDSKATSLAFAPDGRTLFVAHANTTCSQYAVPRR